MLGLEAHERTVRYSFMISRGAAAAVGKIPPDIVEPPEESKVEMFAPPQLHNRLSFFNQQRDGGNIAETSEIPPDNTVMWDAEMNDERIDHFGELMRSVEKKRA